MTIKTRSDAPDQSALDRTAFGVLGATARDNRRRIVELAEERSLSFDAVACSRARADLLNPLARIAAEAAWLPGLSPARANRYRDLLKRNLDELLTSATSESPLVEANLIAAAIERFDPGTEIPAWVKWIMKLADAAGRVDHETVLRLLNEDRVVAGFPAISSAEPVVAELEARRRAYREGIKEALNRLPGASMIDVITTVVEVATADGTKAGPFLIDDVIEDFDAGVRPFLNSEAANVGRLIEATKGPGGQNEAAVDRLLDALERTVRQWDRVAKPIRTYMLVSGREHEPSRVVFGEIRGLVVHLARTRDMVRPAQRLTDLLQHVFRGMPDVDLSQQDAQVLEQRRMQSQHAEQWAKEISYDAELGLVFKSRLRLSTAGLQAFNGRTKPIRSSPSPASGGERRDIPRTVCPAGRPTPSCSVTIRAS